MTQRVELRYEFQRSPIHQPAVDHVDIADDEWIVNVETVPPNPATGCGSRVWIARLADEPATLDP